MFLGLRTVIYAAPDLQKAKAWYAKTLGIAPYFDEPYYVGFNVGGYELGLDPNAKESVATYWGVENIETARQSLLDAGATPDGDIHDVGDGIKMAAVIDPFGKHLDLIYNPHFTGGK
ncbi:MAG: VOC family protein [Rhizobacter sp.]|nr:VOC family protein [Chlorobiales bacterium]